MEVGQLIEYNMRNIYLESQPKNGVEKLESFQKKKKNQN